MTKLRGEDSWGSWAENEESFLFAARNTTPAQRLQWLDETLTFVAANGALEKSRRLEESDEAPTR
jgi:hypothetical protein